MTTPVHELLTRAQDLIRDPKNWVQFSLAMTAAGAPVLPYHDSAVRFSSYGALERVAWSSAIRDPSYRQALQVLKSTLLRLSGHEYVGAYDDASNHEEVMLLWDKARELALAANV